MCVYITKAILYTIHVHTHTHTDAALTNRRVCGIPTIYNNILYLYMRVK